MVRLLSLLFVLVSLLGVESHAQSVSPETVVQRRVEAYNARDIDRFASFYADKVELITLATGEADSGIATAAAAVAGSPATSTVTGPATAPVDTDPDSAPF